MVRVCPKYSELYGMLNSKQILTNIMININLLEGERLCVWVKRRKSWPAPPTFTIVFILKCWTLRQVFILMMMLFHFHTKKRF